MSVDRGARAHSLGPGGLVFDRFRVVERLGQGAIAEVWRARDEQLGVDVALKVLHDNLRRQPAVLDRFRHEVLIGRRIAHPHVVRCFDLLEDPDGPAVLVMEHVGGGDLKAQLLAVGPLGPDAVAQVGVEIASALGAAHRQGVIHRDVKPHNILRSLDGHHKLSDFGVARAAELSGSGGAALGTPEYAAPELVTQARADPRTDIYALGATLFELATGRPPFLGDSPYDVLRMQVEVTPPLASSLRPGVPPWLDEAIAWALAKDPAARPSTADALAEALGRRQGLARVAAAAPPSRRCAGCGAPVLEALALCFRCGAAPPAVDLDAAGRWAVLVVGPGEVAEKLDHALRREILRLVESLPGARLDAAELRRRSPRLPFVLLDRLDRPSADALKGALRALGVEADVCRSPVLLSSSLARSRAWRMTGRWMAVLFAPMVVPLVQIGSTALPIVLGALGVALYMRGERRPVKRLDGAEDGAGRLVALAREVGALGTPELAELARGVFGRALAIARRWPELAGDLAVALQPVTEWLRGLGALEQRLGAFDERDLARRAARGDEGARILLDERRELERARDLYAERTLVAVARLEALELRLASAGLHRAEASAREVVALGDEMRAALEAEAELRSLLAT